MSNSIVRQVLQDRVPNLSPGVKFLLKRSKLSFHQNTVIIECSQKRIQSFLAIENTFLEFLEESGLAHVIIFLENNITHERTPLARRSNIPAK